VVRGGGEKHGGAWCGEVSGDLQHACLGSVSSEISKRWRYAGTAISGHEIGLAELDQDCSRIFFLRCGRIFFALDAALNVSANPSGHVPSVGRDGRARRSFFGRVHGLDRVSAVVSRVLSVKIRDHVVILCSLKVLYANMYPPPEV
jgi:hypothetical protein